MAAEASRETSRKVAAAKRALGLRGYWMGGAAPFGFERWRLSRTGAMRRLEPGELTGGGGVRTILRPGPPPAVQTVRRIFQLFALKRLSYREIARRLNAENAPGLERGYWASDQVEQLLRQELYAGIRVIGATTSILGTVTRYPKGQRVRAAGVMEPVVSMRLFRAAQRRIRTKDVLPADGVLIDELRALLRQHGRLSMRLISRHGPRNASCYRLRFGDILVAYARAGYAPSARQLELSGRSRRQAAAQELARARADDETWLAPVRALLAREGRLSHVLIKDDPASPWPGTLVRRFGTLRRVYELVGYAPTPLQDQRLRARARSRLAQRPADNAGLPSIRTVDLRGLLGAIEGSLHTPPLDAG